MGQSISGLVESLQQDAEKEKLANDALSSLIELAKLQVDAFELAVSNATANNKLIPIDQIIKKDYIIHAMTSDQPKDVGEIIKQSFSDFANGPVGDGLGNLVQAGLGLLLGSYSGSTSTRDIYAISCGELGGLSRIDMHFFSYRYTSKQLTEICKNVISISVVLSSVDVNKVSDSSLSVIVQSTYKDSSKEERKAMLAQLIAAKNNTVLPSPAQLSSSLEKGCQAVRSGTSGGLQVPGGYFKQTQGFFVTTGIGRATAAALLVRQYLLGYLIAENQRHGGAWFMAYTVVCDPDPMSISDVMINGTVTITMDHAFHGALLAYLHIAVEGALRQLVLNNNFGVEGGFVTVADDHPDNQALQRKAENGTGKETPRMKSVV